MATDKTPKNKRIKRAETGRDDWKQKATLRREEIEKLKRELESQETILSKTINENHELENKLTVASKRISEQEKLIENLKKKSVR
jgi:septal ring factor EnvC (AmiA/AmiB activator)